jgi:hypothetical protein
MALTPEELKENYKNRNWPKVRLSSRGPRPHIWKSGTDPVAHDQYTALLKHRAQANFRKELHLLTFEDWRTLWRDSWDQRGRSIDSLCLIRVNPNEPWCLHNCAVITRREQLKIQSEQKLGIKYRKRQYE